MKSRLVSPTGALGDVGSYRHAGPAKLGGEAELLVPRESGAEAVNLGDKLYGSLPNQEIPVVPNSHL